MDIIVKKEQLKNFLKKKHDLDLSDGKLQMITSKWELPMVFDNIMTPSLFNSYLNRFGPFFYLKGKKNSYLGQEQDGEWKFYDVREYLVPLDQVYINVGIPQYLGMKPDELAELYDIE